MLAGALLLAAWVREVTWIVERLRAEDDGQEEAS
jgi:hypothetical protein